MKIRVAKAVAVLTIGLFLFSLSAWSEDEGILLLSEGPIVEAEDPGLDLSVLVSGTAGLSATGTVWALAGAEAVLVLDPFEFRAHGEFGTNRISLGVGADTVLAGIRVGGDVAFVGGAAVVDLHAWGEIAGISLTGSASMAGNNTSLTLGASTDLGGFGVSGSVAVAGGQLASAGVGVNTDLGGLSISGNAGLRAGLPTVGASAGFELGPLHLGASAGYDGGLGLNGSATAGGRFGPLELAVIALTDNTGFGLEGSAALQLGAASASATARVAGAGVNAEISGRLPVGSMAATISVGLDNQTGFGWAELNVEMPF